uniref:Mei2-like C-terminal RNA recognition motif domain-containing protein n=1 Tax=Oxyrrhis marina TaxID=2969 RepID=A0A7S4GMR8_OXYMA
MAFLKNTFLDFSGAAQSSRRRTQSEGPVVRELVCWVPGEVAQQQKKENSEAQEITTMMLKNIPVGLSHDEVKESLLSLGVSFDVLHVPADVRSGCNRGYTFLNCPSPGAYEDAATKLHNSRLPGFPGSKKVLEVCLAKVQGKAALKHVARGRQAAGRKNR